MKNAVYPCKHLRFDETLQFLIDSLWGLSVSVNLEDSKQNMLNPHCLCGAENQTILHTTQECELTVYQGNPIDINNGHNDGLFDILKLFVSYFIPQVMYIRNKIFSVGYELRFAPQIHNYEVYSTIFCNRLDQKLLRNVHQYAQYKMSSKFEKLFKRAIRRSDLD